jgi:hypothetical protein
MRYGRVFALLSHTIGGCGLNYSRKIPFIVLIIAGFSLVAFSKSSNILKTGSLLDSLSGRQASASINKSSEIANDSVAVKLEDGPCDRIECMDLYPEDHKVEGRNISIINPAGINNHGQVVGLCVLDGPVAKYPFVREPDGRLWIFRTPSPSGQGEFTDISDSGDAVGFYQDNVSKANVGFLMDSKGKWAMDVKYPVNPCSNNSPYLQTQPNGVNQEGEIIGNYVCTKSPDESIDAIFTGNGFYRSAEGTYFQIQYENAKRTVAGKISNNGIIIGY